jgi:hypothetical protein
MASKREIEKEERDNLRRIKFTSGINKEIRYIQAGLILLEGKACNEDRETEDIVNEILKNSYGQ